jgi:hypothetical protein
MGNLGKTNFVNSSSNVILSIDPDATFVQVRMFTTDGTEFFQLTNSGSLSLGNESARLDGTLGWLLLGADGKAGVAVLRNANKDTKIQLDAGSGQITMANTAKQGAVRLDANASDQQGHALLALGGGGTSGVVLVNDAPGINRIRLDGNVGTITMANAAGQGALRLDANASDQSGGALLALGGAGTNGNIVVNNAVGVNVIRLDGASGDIVLANADCAEEFAVSDCANVEPGAVVVIDDEGALRPGDKAYDKRVAGVVSGAGGYKPGITLDRQTSETNRMPVALLGKVYCKVDANYAAIEVGSMLTTSPTLGHAMSAIDPARAFGSVIGKALRPLKTGTGMIPILVALQ